MHVKRLMAQWRFPFILLVSLMLFVVNLGGPRPKFQIVKASSFINSHLLRMKEIQHKEHFALSRAFILGDKRSLTKKLKIKFSKLHINHLFTPSGIHFTSFFLIFVPLLKRLKKRGNKKFALVFEIGICLLPFSLGGFYSLKRISTLRITNILLKKLKFKIDFYYIFLISFLIDFIFGTYTHNPMSYAFSFLFLGSLLSNTKLSSIALSFFSANLFLTIFFHSKVSLLGFFLGFLLTSIFSILFPFLFLFYWLSSLVQYNLSFPFLWVINYSSSLFYTLSAFSPSVSIDVVGLFFIFIYAKTRKFRFIIFAIILSGEGIYNIPSKRVGMKTKDNNQIITNWKNDNKVERGRNNDFKCARKILTAGHQIRCRKVKRRWLSLPLTHI